MGCPCSKFVKADIAQLATLKLAPLPENLQNALVDFHLCWENFISGKNPSYQSFIHPPEEVAIHVPSAHSDPSEAPDRPQTFWYDEMYHLLIVESATYPHPLAAQLSETIRNRSLLGNVGTFTRFTRMLMEVMVHCHEEQIRTLLADKKRVLFQQELTSVAETRNRSSHSEEKSASSASSSSSSPSSSLRSSPSSPSHSFSMLLNVSNLAVIAAKHNRVGVDHSLLLMLSDMLPKLYRRCFGSAYQDVFDMLLKDAYGNIVNIVWNAQQMEKDGLLKEYINDGEDLDKLGVKF